MSGTADFNSIDDARAAMTQRQRELYDKVIGNGGALTLHLRHVPSGEVDAVLADLEHLSCMRVVKHYKTSRHSRPYVVETQILGIYGSWTLDRGDGPERLSIRVMAGTPLDIAEVKRLCKASRVEEVIP